MKKPNEMNVHMSRRRLLQGSGIALGGLVLSTWLPPLVSKSAAAEAAAAGRLGDRSAEGYGAFVRIGHDGVVTVISPKIEMGQGAQTGIAMMVAEELEVGLDQVVIQEAPPNSALYTDTLLQFQATGGSTSTRYTWEPLRRAGATARVLLIQAAALQWHVAPSLCHAQNGQVFGPGGRVQWDRGIPQAQLHRAEDMPRKPVAGKARRRIGHWAIRYRTMMMNHLVNVEGRASRPAGRRAGRRPEVSGARSPEWAKA